MDPAKLKVVELRQELASRGLDQKGVKAVLVQRLKEALDAENADAPKSGSSESGEESDQNVEPTLQPVDTIVTSPSEKEDVVEQQTPMEEEPEKVAESEVEASTKAPEVIENVPSGTADSVTITEDPEILPEQSIPKQCEQSEPMDINEDANIEHKIELAVPQDIRVQEDDTKTDIQESNDSNDDTPEPKQAQVESVESVAVEGESEAQKQSVDGDEDIRSTTTQSEDTKRDGESDSDRKDRKRRRSRSRSKSSSPSVKRTRRASPIQNTDDFTNDEDEPEIDSNAVLLSWFDSDLNLKVNSSEFLSARPISEGPLHMAWAGVRATHGVKSGKVSYEVIIDDLNRFRGESDRNPYEIRCGWSVKTTSLQLGETPLSFGYGGSGKKSLNNEFTDYGCKFKSRGDVIGVYLDLEGELCKIEYTVNGEPQGVAFEFDKSELGDEALYPHILSKNMGFKVNFGEMEKPYVSKIKPKSKEDDRRDSRRDRRSDRDSRRDRSRDRSRSRSRSRSRDDRRERSEDKEKSSSKKERSSEDEKPTNDDESTSKENSDKPSVSEEKVEEKVQDAVEGEENASEVASEKNGDSQTKNAEEEGNTEKAMLPGYEFIGKLPLEQLVPGYSRLDSRKDCEIILLIGLPGSGKSFWAKNYASENPEKRYNILGVQPLLLKMTISGEPRKKHVDMKWDRFIDSCTRGVNIIQDIASKRRRNYIIDQPNVIWQNQRRKIRGFGDFKRRAIVFIPDDDEYKQRLEKKLENEGKEVSEYSSDDMKANFSIPKPGCWFDDIQFIGLEGEEAKKKVAEYNEQGKKALASHPSSYNRSSRDYDRHRRDDFRDNRDRNRRWGGDRGDRRYDYRSDNWRGVTRFDRRDRWHGGGSSNYGQLDGYRRYDDRRHGNMGGNYGRRDFGHERDRRDDRGRSRNDHRDFRDGNREDKRRHDRGVPQREKDEKHVTKPQQNQYQNYKSTKTEPPTQGHWNPSVVGPHANNWNNYYQQQNWGEYNQQNWAQWNQQQAQSSNNYANQQPQQDWSNWQQQTQQPPPPPQQQQPQQPQQQQDAAQGGWQNWAQHAQTYANAGDQTGPVSK